VASDSQDTTTSDADRDARRILEERARLLARPPDERARADVLDLVAFSVGTERYAVEADFVQEVQPLDRATWSRVPCAPEFIVGAVNIRGRIYSLMDVGHFLSLPPRPLSEAAHVLLVAGKDSAGEQMELSILADDVPEALDVPRGTLRPAAETVASGGPKFVRGVTEDMLIVLDLRRLLEEPGIVVHEEA